MYAKCTVLCKYGESVPSVSVNLLKVCDYSGPKEIMCANANFETITFFINFKK